MIVYFCEVRLVVCIVIDCGGCAETGAVVQPTSDVVELYDNTRLVPFVLLIGFT